MVQLCFGLLPLWGKWAFDGFGPRTVAGWRIAAGAIVLGGFAFAVYGRRAVPTFGDLVRLQICSLLGIVLNQVLYLEGLERSTSVNAGLMMLLIPVFTYGIAVAVRQERWSGLRALGILVACAGTAQLVLQKGPDLSRPHLVGNLLIAANTFLFSIYLVISRPLARRYPPLVVIAWAYVLGVWTIPLIAHDSAFFPATATSRAWWSLGMILLFPTVLGYLLNVFALSRVPASTTAVYVFMQPLIAGFAGVLLLQERLTGSTLVAAAAIFVGIWLVVRPRRQ